MRISLSGYSKQTEGISAISPLKFLGLVAEIQRKASNITTMNSPSTPDGMEPPSSVMPADQYQQDLDPLFGFDDISYNSDSPIPDLDGSDDDDATASSTGAASSLAPATPDQSSNGLHHAGEARRLELPPLSHDRSQPHISGDTIDNALTGTSVGMSGAFVDGHVQREGLDDDSYLHEASVVLQGDGVANGGKIDVNSLFHAATGRAQPDRPAHIQGPERAPVPLTQGPPSAMQAAAAAIGTPLAMIGTVSLPPAFATPPTAKQMATELLRDERRIATFPDDEFPLSLQSSAEAHAFIFRRVELKYPRRRYSRRGGGA